MEYTLFDTKPQTSSQKSNCCTENRSACLLLLGRENCQVTHGGPAGGAVPWRLEVGQVVQDAPHGCAVQGLANHDGGAAGPHGQHRSHPASLFLWHSSGTGVKLLELPSEAFRSH